MVVIVVCDQILCIHGRRHNTCGNCIRKTNEKMKRKLTKSNRTVNNCDNFCEHFESFDVCKECIKNIKLHQDPVYVTDNIGKG